MSAWITTEGGVPITTEGGVIIVTESQPPGPPEPLQSIIPSYLYREYADDPYLRAFVAGYNTIAQSYLNWFNQTPLGVYTNANVSGPLLDFVMNGLYGISRPVFSTLQRRFRAGINAFPINRRAINQPQLVQSGTAVVASDDFYKRVATWILYVGNGRNFNIPMLRLRIARFLYGVNGTDIPNELAQNIHIQAGTLPGPGAPVLAYTPGGSIAARTYGVQNTYTNSNGETTAGAISSLTVPANNLLMVQSPPPENGAIDWNTYVNVLSSNPGHFIAGINSGPINTMQSAVDGTNKAPVSAPTRQNATPIAIGTPWVEPASGLIAGAALPTENTAGLANGFIITIPPGTASQYFQQAFEQGTLPFPFQLDATVVIA